MTRQIKILIIFFITCVNSQFIYANNNIEFFNQSINSTNLEDLNSISSEINKHNVLRFSSDIIDIIDQNPDLFEQNIEYDFDELSKMEQLFSDQYDFHNPDLTELLKNSEYSLLSDHLVNIEAYMIVLMGISFFLANNNNVLSALPFYDKIFKLQICKIVIMIVVYMLANMVF